MSITTRLPLDLSPPPFGDESARGLIARHAERHLSTPDQMCHWLGLPTLTRPMEADPQRAAEMMSMDATMLTAMGFGSNGSEPFLGHRVPVDAVVHTHMRFCPDCLLDAPYHRRIWDHRQIQCCPIHRLALVSKCPTCGGQTGWGRTYVAHHYCGDSLTVAAARVQVPAEECLGAAAVYRLCGISCDGPDLPLAFAGLPLQELIDLLMFFGRMDVVVAQGNIADLKATDMLTDGRVLSHGTRIAMGWPASFDDLANRVRAARPGLTGVSHQYGQLHRFIVKSGDAGYGPMLQGAYARHLAARGDVTGLAWPPGLPKPDGFADDVALTALQVRRHLGLGQKSFAALRRTALWPEFTRLAPGRNGAPQFRMSDVAALNARLDRLMSPYAADRMLGVSKRKTSQLLDVGMLPVILWNRRNRQGEGRSIDGADIEALLDRVRQHATDVPPRKGVSFTKVLAMAAQRRAANFADVVRGLIEGRLQGHLAYPASPGLSAFIFEEKVVDEALAEMAARSPARGIALGKVVRRLGLPAKSVHQLVEERLLSEPTRGNAITFDPAAIDAFDEVYVTDAALAKARGVSRDSVRASLALAGVKPITALSSHGVAQVALYRRADLKRTAADISKGAQK